jgi:hypothetical protein
MMTEGTENVGAMPLEMDRLSLSQALVDFEIANARVIDLTRRLLEAEANAAGLRGQLDELRSEHEDLLAAHELMKSSQAFRTANKIWAIRNAIGI